MWWKCYLDATLLPFDLLSGAWHGLEAHLQNTLIAFHDGWPSSGYARDMEGVDIGRTRFQFLDRLPGDSPVLYAEEQAWHRFQYYVLSHISVRPCGCLSGSHRADYRAGIVARHRIDVELDRRPIDTPIAHTADLAGKSQHAQQFLPAWGMPIMG